MISRERSKRSGFTLIEILMVLLLISVLTIVSVSLVSKSADDSRFQETLDEMHAIANAISGDKNLREGGSRTSFGYFGDVGAMPSAIGDLITKPVAVSAYAVSSATRTAYGWNGPYLLGADSGADYTQDAWGNNYVFSPAASPPTLVSYGADGAAGGVELNQDITVTFTATDRVATVEGFVSDAGAPFTTAAEAELNYPDGTGGLAQDLDSTLSANNGHFSFANVPYGVRSVTIYAPSKAAPTSTIGPVIVTVDKPKVMVPANQLDFNP